MPDTTTTPPPAQSDGRPHLEGLLAEVMDEVYWFNEHVNEGLFDQYADEHVAIYRRAVVDHDPDRVALVDRVADAFGVPINRPFYAHVPGPYVLPGD